MVQQYILLHRNCGAAILFLKISFKKEVVQMILVT